MSIKQCGYRLDSCKFYPRPNHFKKRLDCLIPRFNNVIGAFEEQFHDRKCLRKIDDNYIHMSKPIVVSLMGDESQRFDPNRVVICEADELATVPDTFSTSTFERAGLYITVCFITVEDVGERGKETVQGIIEYVTKCLSQCSTDKKLFESLFVFCELSEYFSESEITSFREYINGCLSQKSSQWPGTSQIVLGPDHVTLGSVISDYIENNLLDTFTLINEYLNRFVRKHSSQSDIHDNLAHAKDVEDALFNFVRNAIELAEMRQRLIHLDEDTRTEKAKFVDDVIDFLAKKLKCVLVAPLSVKLGLKRDVCHTCLNEIGFDKIVRKQLSSSTKIHLKKLYEFSNGYEEKLQKVHREGHTLYMGNDYMIPRLQNDLSAALSEVETELKKAVKQIFIMGQMMFEIEGYFSLAERTTTYLQQNNHLKAAEVVGAGTIAQGDLITSSNSDGTPSNRGGTLGIFVQGRQKNAPDTQSLYALMSGHVVNTYGTVYVKGNGKHLNIKLGVSKPELTVTCGSEKNAPLVDIAAVKIDPEVLRYCLKKVKNEEGFYKRSFVPDLSLHDLEKQVVYMFGAKSGLSRGIVLSYEYCNEIAGYILVIDRLPGTKENFAQPGDSGAVVCSSSINIDQPDGIVAVVGMVLAGDYQIKGFLSNLCLAFLFKKGLEALQRRSGLLLETL